MTVQAAKKMWSRDGGSVVTPDSRKRVVTFREGWQVICDPTDKTEDAYGAADLPNVGDVYPGTTSVVCKRKSPTRISPIFFIFDIEYQGEIGPGGITDSPLNDPATVTWGKVDYTEPVSEDLSGEAIATVNAEPIVGVTKNFSDLVATIKKNYLGIDLAATHAYLHSVNSDVFLGFAPGTGRMTSFSAQEKIAQGFNGTFWEVTATIQFRWPYRTTADKAWYARVLHEGFQVNVGGGVIKHARKDGELVTTPVLLKSDGTLETDPASAHWLEFQLYDPLPYNALGLF